MGGTLHAHLIAQNAIKSDTSDRAGHRSDPLSPLWPHPCSTMPKAAMRRDLEEEWVRALG
jgi:hypothetical protein